MRTVLIGLAILGLLIAAGTYFFGRQIMMAYMIYGTRPPADFAALPPPPAPDYANPAHWSALPEREDAADVVPAGLAKPDQTAASVDVFFIHPTTYFGRRWNQPLDDATANARTDTGPVRHQASVFNASARVYAPRYRQATFAAFFDPANMQSALGLAYEDVRAAFAHYLAVHNQGRPFILASHSQGSRHALWLLEDVIKGSDLEARLVAAYIVGYATPTEWFARRLGSIGLCEEARQTRCVATWATYAEDADAPWVRQVEHRYGESWESNEGKAIACVNPLSWTTGPEPVPATANLGGWVFSRGEKGLDVAVTGARCDAGILRIARPADRAWTTALLPGGNYHNYDYQLFWMNIRENVATRVAAYLEANPGPLPLPGAPAAATP